jgi:hypothetical protein
LNYFSEKGLLHRHVLYISLIANCAAAKQRRKSAQNRMSPLPTAGETYGFAPNYQFMQEQD